jgi:hypothetical protein
LFVRFHATSGRSDFSVALIVGYGLRPSRQRLGRDWWGRLVIDDTGFLKQGKASCGVAR